MPPKQVTSWALYDWANSAFATTIIAGFFPIFFKTYWSHGLDPTVSTAHLGQLVAASAAILALLSPFLGALADSRQSKKKILAAFLVLGSSACLVMGSLSSGQWMAAAFAYALGLLGFSGGNIFYDSLLPGILGDKKSEQVSALGYSLGYLGGGLLFALNVWFYLQPQFWGFADGVAAIRFSFFSVGIWWLLFSIPLFIWVKEPLGSSETTPLTGVLKTIRNLNKNTLIFLLAFWLYIDGVDTIISMAIDYGMSIGLDKQDLIVALLITQFVGFPAALGFGYLSNKLPTRPLILLAIGVYFLVVFGASQMTKPIHFYVLAATIGLVQGGIQSLSRGYFARMVPPTRSAEYFALYNLVGKTASIIGPLAVGYTTLWTGDHRRGILSLCILFAGGGFLLLKVKDPKYSDHKNGESHA